jgi:hypothetical protein
VVTSKARRLKDSKRCHQHDTPGSVVAVVMCIAKFHYMDEDESWAKTIAK